MLRRMQRRFIMAAMAAVSVVMAVILTMINVWNYMVTTEHQDHVIMDIWGYENGKEPMKPPDHDSEANRQKQRLFFGFQEKGGPHPSGQEENQELPFITRFFIVRIKEDGTVQEVGMDFIASVSEAEASDYGITALKRGQEKGYLDQYRYRVFEEEERKTVIFLNVSRELDFMETLLLISFAAAGGILFVVFLLVALFSRKAIHPYLKNIERQKRFITDASHELKTPLTSISTSVDIIAMEYGEDEWVENIKRQTKRLAKLTEDLVMLSRLDEERPLPEKQKFSVSDCVWELSEPFSSLAEARKKNYSQSIEDDVWMEGDPGLIKQMVSLLLDNALKYSDAEGRISLDLYKRHKKVFIEVYNTCQLEHISHLGQLFERFYRPDSSRSRNTGGSGIGLSIVQAAAEAHGGSVQAESADGTWIRFRVILPLSGLHSFGRTKKDKRWLLRKNI